MSLHPASPTRRRWPCVNIAPRVCNRREEIPMQQVDGVLGREPRGLSGQMISTRCPGSTTTASLSPWGWVASSLAAALVAAYAFGKFV
jgi:hypothetical protein